jgi:hypothetical protein
LEDPVVACIVLKNLEKEKLPKGKLHKRRVFVKQAEVYVASANFSNLYSMFTQKYLATFPTNLDDRENSISLTSLYESFLNIGRESILIHCDVKKFQAAEMREPINQNLNFARVQRVGKFEVSQFGTPWR